MIKLVEKYIEVRDYLKCYLNETIDIFLVENYTPLTKFLLIKETNKLLDREIKLKFPDFPAKFYPKVKFRIYEDKHEIEIGLQRYLNQDSDLTFLGMCDIGETEFDFYLSKSFSSSSEFTFYARYGHVIDNIYSGSKVAAAEYFQGKITPLSVAFSMAIEDGFIS